MKAIIFKEIHRASQQGKSGLPKWKLEYKDLPSSVDPITGWTSNTNTIKQINLTFEDLDQAISYAVANNIDYEIIQLNSHVNLPKSYTNNFT